MKHQILASVLAIVGCASWAQEMGRVISATPITQQVALPRQVCSTEWVPVAQRSSGAGAVIGAVAGGALAHAVTHGRGPGQGAVTLIGALGGAIIGDRLERNRDQPSQQMQPVQRCHTQTYFESRTVAYNVVYVYAGKQYHMQTPQPPGRHVALQVVPVGAGVWVKPALQLPPAPVPRHWSPGYSQRDERRYEPRRDDRPHEFGDDDARHWRY